MSWLVIGGFARQLAMHDRPCTRKHSMSIVALFYVLCIGMYHIGVCSSFTLRTSPLTSGLSAEGTRLKVNVVIVAQGSSGGLWCTRLHLGIARLLGKERSRGAWNVLVVHSSKVQG